MEVPQKIVLPTKIIPYFGKGAAGGLSWTTKSLLWMKGTALFQTGKPVGIRDLEDVGLQDRFLIVNLGPRGTMVRRGTT